jgi:ABC-type multidrug transport system ATPase subunit/pSer/pThr/pTyr-binding forkhead associated (FHA) protein
MTPESTRSDLIVLLGGREYRLQPNRVWSVGRGPGCDIVANHTSVSRKHGEFVFADGSWVYRDLGSANKSWVAGRSVTKVPISSVAEIGLGRDTELVLQVRLASSAGPSGTQRPAAVPMTPTPQPSPSGQPAAPRVLSVTKHRLTIGRTPDNDVVVEDLLVSRNHASISRLPNGQFEVVDLGSTNGTFVNGRRVSTAHLGEGDLISIGSHVFRFAAQSVQERLDPSGPWLCAVDIGVTTSKGKALLSGIRFALEPRRLMSIVGPSGAGKSTLLRALTGQDPADHGYVLYGGRDLYASLDLRQRMGYVPQQDLLHAELSVREALDYAAELRFAKDVDATSRSSRIDDVIGELGLVECQHRRIWELSGGERKRTSVAAELLTRPPLLFLDEPTSGLDPGIEDQLTTLLRTLADGGRTVVVATHSIVTLEQCDQVLFLAIGGNQAFYGPPAEASEYFRRQGAGDTYPKVFAALKDEHRARSFASRFAGDPAAKANVEEPLAAARSAQETHPPNFQGGRANTDLVRQWWVLVRRYLAVLKSDRVASLILLAQAPFFALLFNILYPYNVMSTANASEATILIWLMVVGATWIGTSNAIREVVKERQILRREHGLGLSLASYLASKVAVLGVITAAECAFLAIATLGPQHLPAVDTTGQIAIPGSGVLLSPQLLEIVVDVVLAGLAAMGVGLLVSTLVKTADQANFALPLLLVAQVVLSAPILGSPGPVFAALGTVSTAQWGTAATADTISLNQIRRPYLEAVENQRAAAENPPRNPDPSVEAGPDKWGHDLGAWLINIAALLAVLVSSLALAYAVLFAQYRIRPRNSSGL